MLVVPDRTLAPPIRTAREDGLRRALEVPLGSRREAADSASADVELGHNAAPTSEVSVSLGQRQWTPLGGTLDA